MCSLLLFHNSESEIQKEIYSLIEEIDRLREKPETSFCLNNKEESQKIKNSNLCKITRIKELEIKVETLFKITENKLI